MSELPTVSEARVMATLREVVAERPEYVYERDGQFASGDADGISCLYVHRDGPGCLVGTVLHRIGVPLDKLATWEGSGAYVVAGMTAYMPDTARNALARAQDAQDAGATWSAALAAAENLPRGIEF